MTFNPVSSHGNGYPLALTGATAATRYVGATASGAPATGTFEVGDFAIDQTGKVYVCTVAGSPGTWTQAGGASTLSNIYATGHALLPDNDAGGFSAATMVASQLLASPVIIQGSVAATFASVAVSVTTLGAGSAIRLGWYGVAASGGPGALLYDLGTVDSTSTGVKTISTPYTIGPGLVWFASVAQGGTPGVRVLSPTTTPFGVSGGASTNLTSGPLNGVIASGAAAGALPNPFGAYTWPAGSHIFPRFLRIV